jgi:polar amino acid transport system ATP-binding protein
MLQPMVRIENVWKSFGSLTVLRGISFDVFVGEVVCLLGSSGSGKTTLLRCINHLERLDAGRIYVDGELIGYRQKGAKIYEMQEKAVARQRANIGMVFQHFNLFSHMTALENLIEAPIFVNGVSRQSAVERARELLARVGLSDKHNAYPAELSGGQQQRVAIARALAMRPKLMLFDEPTSALDPELVGEVLTVIRDLAREGMTMIIVTHEIAFAREVADRAIFMHNGAIAESGPARELLSNPQQAQTKTFLAKVL